MLTRLPDVLVEKDYAAMSRRAAEAVLDALQAKPDSMVCVATGVSPLGVYAALAEHRDAFAEARVLKLDEWGGLPADDPATCDTYIRRHILGPWIVPEERYIAFGGDAPDPDAECARVCRAIDDAGGLDICILGMGADGHIGLNYPADSLPPRAHATAPSVLRHAMLKDARGTPTHGLTLGMGDVLRARRIVLVVNGEGKADAVARLLSGPIATQFPASLLWGHTNLMCVLDEAAAGRLDLGHTWQTIPRGV
jgi:galactosamine-6-phosphate isomerase